MTCQHPKRLKTDPGQETCSSGVVLLVVMIDSPDSGGWPRSHGSGSNDPRPQTFLEAKLNLTPRSASPCPKEVTMAGTIERPPETRHPEGPRAS